MFIEDLGLPSGSAEAQVRHLEDRSLRYLCTGSLCHPGASPLGGVGPHMSGVGRSGSCVRLAHHLSRRPEGVAWG